MIQEPKAGGVVALRCPRCTWWTASTDLRRAKEQRGHLFEQLVGHLVRAHALQAEQAEQEALRSERA